MYKVTVIDLATLEVMEFPAIKAASKEAAIFSAGLQACKYGVLGFAGKYAVECVEVTD